MTLSIQRNVGMQAITVNLRPSGDAAIVSAGLDGKGTLIPRCTVSMGVARMPRIRENETAAGMIAEHLYKDIMVTKLVMWFDVWGCRDGGGQERDESDSRSMHFVLLIWNQW